LLLRFGIIILISVILFSPILVNEVFAVPVKTVLDDDDFEIVRILSVTDQTGAGRNCTTLPRTITQDTGFEVFTGVIGGLTTGREVCRFPIMVFNITAIPDNATPINATLHIDVASSSDTLPASTNVDNGYFYPILNEMVTGLTTQALFDITMSSGSNIDIDIFHFNISGDIFNGVTGFLNSTNTSAFLTDFETKLESGENFYNLFACPLDNAEGSGCAFSTNQDGIARVFYDPTTSFLEITWDIFFAPSEPLSVTATYSPSPDECLVDWLQPADDGGRVVTGYQVERSTNFAPFSILIADTGASTPTDHTDTTIISGESYRYRISAINAEGVGVGSTESNSCGIPAPPDPPVGLFAFESSANDIGLDWTRPNYDGALPITYLIERSASGGSFVTHVPNTGNDDTTFVDVAVQSNILFNYRVSTINSNGTSSPSNESSFTIVVSTGGGAVVIGSPVGTPEDEELLTQLEFDKALAEAIAQIPPQEITVVETVIETVIQTFFEFAIVDVTNDQLTLNSFLKNERLGIRWSSGQDIVIVSATPALSPFSLTFEQFPVIKRGSGAVISTDFILYDLQVPRNECTTELITNCVEKIRYEIPITVNAVLNGTNVSDRGTITINLTEDPIDVILLILLSTLSIPLVAGIVQRSRGRSGVIQTVRRAS